MTNRSILVEAPTPLPVCILGAGGHARSAAALARRLGRTILAFIDMPEGVGPSHMGGIPIWYGDDNLKKFPPTALELVNGVASVQQPTLRRSLFLDYKNRGYRFASLIDPAACVFVDARLGEGCQVLAGAIVQTGAQLAENVLINTRAVVEHDCTVGAHSHIAPGSILCGGVTVGPCCHVGAGATVLQGVTLAGENVVGGGGAVASDVDAGTTVMGVPARPLNR